MYPALKSIGPINGNAKKAILARFTSLYSSRADRLLVEGMGAIICKLCDAKSPSWQFSVGMGMKSLSGFNLWPYTDGWKKTARELASFIDNALRAKGYRGNGSILTWQEHRLIGSTIDYMVSPYMPIGIETGKLSIEEAKLARELVVFEDFIACHFGNSPALFYVPALLEPLDANGLTVRDPRQINSAKFSLLAEKGALYEEAVEGSLVRGLEKSGNFPARRD
ncbi:MAG: hypothetical protein WCT52_03540 [Candidatus Micrarchaeia archaeon]